MSSAGAVGVDFGGNSAVIALAKKGGVEVIVNEASHRETRIVVGFGEKQRFLGEQGYVQLKSNFKNTVVYPNRFLGLRVDAPYYNEEKKWLYSPISTTPDNRLTFDVTYAGEKRQFTPEQITAMMFQTLKQNIKENDVAHNELVISVPSYYTEQERKALLDAAKIAEVNVVKLMNESTAITLGYGIFRKAELTATARNVCFIDFGHCKTSAFVSSFTNSKAKILHQVHERNLGVRDIDWQLLEFYGKICVDKFDANPIKKEKARLRMIDAIEKQRKILSANSEAAINVDYIVEDNDLSYQLTREKLEELAGPVVERFRALLESLKAQIKEPIHSIEIVGGGTRIPIIQRAIQEVFGTDVSRTLNASECVARGCAIQAAMLSPLFKVAPYDVEEANYYPIRCSWLFKSEKEDIEIESDAKNNPEKQTSVLFAAGCSIPNIKSVTFHRDEKIDFKLFYDPVPAGADALLANFMIQPAKPKEKEFGIKLRVQLNRDGIVEFDSAQLIEEYEEAQPDKMNEEPKAGENKEAPKTDASKKKTRTTKLTAELSSINSLPQKKIEQLKDVEYTMFSQDKLIRETLEKKNEFESYIYEMRNKLGEKFAAYATSQVKSALLQDLEKGENWLYSEGMETTKDVYAQRLEELKKVGEPISNRFKEYEAIPEVSAEFLQNLATYDSVASSADAQFEHLTAEEKAAVAAGVKEHRDWLASVSDAFSRANRTENPQVSSKDILSKHKSFVDKHYSTINKPKPKVQPKTEEAPKEEKPTEKKMEEEK
jgi:heat shock protein 4